MNTCIDCERGATHNVEELDFCAYHFTKFEEELEVQADIGNEY